MRSEKVVRRVRKAPFAKRETYARLDGCVRTICTTAFVDERRQRRMRKKGAHGASPLCAPYAAEKP